jgi:hypothetical protein
LDRTAGTEKTFAWGRWALIGAIGWLVAMIALGTPVLGFLAPVAGVILGWVVGGIVYLVITSFRT